MFLQRFFRKVYPELTDWKIYCLLASLCTWTGEYCWNLRHTGIHLSSALLMLSITTSRTFYFGRNHHSTSFQRNNNNNNNNKYNNLFEFSFHFYILYPCQIMVHPLSRTVSHPKDKKFTWSLFVHQPREKFVGIYNELMPLISKYLIPNCSTSQWSYLVLLSPIDINVVLWLSHSLENCCFQQAILIWYKTNLYYISYTKLLGTK